MKNDRRPDNTSDQEPDDKAPIVAINTCGKNRVLGYVTELLGAGAGRGFVSKCRGGPSLAMPGLAGRHHTLAALSCQVRFTEGRCAHQQCLSRLELDAWNQQLGRADFLRADRSATRNITIPASTGCKAARACRGLALRSHVSWRRLELR